MNLENQVVSLELSKKMKTLGFEQDSEWYWDKDGNLASMDYYSRFQDKKLYSAFTVGELGEMLPDEIEMTVNGEELIYVLRCMKTLSGQWLIQYADYTDHNQDSDELHCSQEKNEANARAKMWLYLKENNLLGE